MIRISKNAYVLMMVCTVTFIGAYLSVATEEVEVKSTELLPLTPSGGATLDVQGSRGGNTTKLLLGMSSAAEDGKRESKSLPVTSGPVFEAERLGTSVTSDVIGGDEMERAFEQFPRDTAVETVDELTPERLQEGREELLRIAKRHAQAMQERRQEFDGVDASNEGDSRAVDPYLQLRETEDDGGVEYVDEVEQSDERRARFESYVENAADSRR